MALPQLIVEAAFGADVGAAYKESVLALNPAGYWRLGEAVGASTALDSSGNANAAGKTGTVTFGVAGGLPGDPDTGCTIVGASNLLSGGHLALGTSGWTMECFYKSTDGSANAGMPMFCSDAATGGHGPFLRLESGIIKGYIFDTVISDWKPALADVATSNDGQWHHVALTWNGGTLTLYRDGVKVASSVLTVTQQPTGSQTYIGSYNGNTQNFNGSLDEVAIYNTALSATDIAYHYEARLVVPQSSWAWYDLVAARKVRRVTTTGRGRQNEQDHVGTGTIDVLLNNHDRSFEQGYQGLYSGARVLTLSGNELTDAVRAGRVRGDGFAAPGGVGIFQGFTNLFKNTDLAVDLTNWSASNYTVVNLVAGDFESGATGPWNFAGGGTGSRAVDGTHVHGGTEAVKVTTGGDAVGQGIDADTGTSGPACTPGQAWVAGAWVYCATARPFTVQLAWYDSSGTFLSNTVGAITNAPAGTYTQVVVTGNAPASAAHVGIRVRFSGTVADTFWMDDAQLVQAVYGVASLTPSNGAVSRLNDPNLPVNNGEFLRYTITTRGGWGGYFQNAIQAYWAGWPGGAAFDTASKYTLSFWGRVQPGGSGQPFKVGLMDGTSTNIVLPLTNFNLPADGVTWQRFSVTFTPLVAGSSPVVWATAGGGTLGVGDVIDIAGIQLTKTSVLTPYEPSSTAAFGSRGAGRVQAPAALLSATKGWVAVARRRGWASTQNDTVVPFCLSDGTLNNRIAFVVTGPGGSYSPRSVAGGTNYATVGAATAKAFAAGDVTIEVYAWDGDTIKVSVGGAFVTGTRTGFPGFTPTLLDLGNQLGSNQVDDDVLWMACGIGSVNDSDAAHIAALPLTGLHLADFCDVGEAPQASKQQPTLFWNAVTGAFETWAPYYPNVRAEVPVRVRVDNTVNGDTIRPLMAGNVESWGESWLTPTYGEVEMTAHDAMALLNANDGITFSAPAELAGARESRVLTAAGVPAANRTVDAGISTIQPSVLAAAGALSHAQDVETTEAGLLFASKDYGSFVFKDRQARQLQRSASVMTFGDHPDGTTEFGYASVSPSYDDSHLVNFAKVTRNGGTLQIAQDTASRREHGIASVDYSTLHNSDADALTFGQFQLLQYAQPLRRIDQLTVALTDTDPAALITGCLSLELGDRITIIKRPSGPTSPFAAIAVQCIIEKIEWQIELGQPWVVTFQLSPADTTVYWSLGTVGASELGATTRLSP